MSEPSTHIPGDVADAQVDEAADEAPETPQTPEKVELKLDEDKLEAWDKVKSDYQVDPGATNAPPGVDEDGMDEVAPG